ncbi:cystinosin homolog isoform X1 [Bolinopsis microptera]|uniref:cystinosin homolog isoform X1 n=1 Tax=Bolinopsis microptera TaxID=2820187 RepID=UPI003079E742
MYGPLLLLTTLLTTTCSLDNTTLVTLTTPHSKLQRNETSTLTLQLNEVVKEDLLFNCTPSSQDLLTIYGGQQITVKNTTNSTTVNVKTGGKGGTFYISTELLQHKAINLTISDLEMCVVHSEKLETVIEVLGWLCFAVWSISFYPQIYQNWSRKSVFGLSFDFLGYNLLGWICYSAFNFSLLWVTPVRNQYYDAFPHGVINVQLSDFCFSFHALFITAFTILQCICYERGGQRPSPLCLFILTAFGCGMVLMLIVATSCCITWFQYVTIFSYVKLAVTVFKYSPQVYMNFKNKSTEAVSIYQFLLDLSGGVLSLIQMGLIAYNYDDWMTFLGDFTKFGLAVLSILYDLIFITQHYILYRVPAYSRLGEERIRSESSEALLQAEEGQDSDRIISAPVDQLG